MQYLNQNQNALDIQIENETKILKKLLKIQTIMIIIYVVKLHLLIRMSRIIIR